MSPIDSAQIPSNSTNLRFLALGDSYTIGESVPEKDRWPLQLTARLNNAGFSIDPPEIIARTGWTTDELDLGIKKANPKGPYDLVSLLIGVNNQYRGRSSEEYRTQFQDLLQQAIVFADNAPTRVIVLSIPDWGVTPFAAGLDSQRIAAEIEKFNSINQAEAKLAGTYYADITQISKRAAQNLKLIAPDGLHPSGEMYKMWADLVFPICKSILARSLR